MSDYILEGILKLRDETSKATQTAAQGVGKLEGVIKTASAALTAFGVVKAAQAAIKLGELGAQAQRTENGFNVISGGAAAAEDNLRAMMDATDGAIDRTSAMGIANQMMQMGLASNAEELGKNAELATRLGRAMGVDALTAMTNWNAMMANQSLPRLDTFGISSGKVRTRIEELMGSIQGLTREQAFNMAVMEQGEAALARLGDSAQDSALQIEQSKAALSDLKNEIGMAFANAVGSGESAVGKFTRAWGDNLRIMRDSDGEIGVLEANFGMLFDVLGFGNTVFDDYRNAQEAASAETARLTAQAEAYTAKAQEQAEATFHNAVAGQDSAEAWKQYSAALDMGEASITATLDASARAANALDAYKASQQAASDAAAIAATNFYETAAALGEMSVATMAQSQLEALKAELDAGKISQEQYRDATRAVLTEFGLLTPAEQSAQEQLDTLRQAYIDGKVTADQYADGVAAIKANLDLIQSKEITIDILTVYRDEDRRQGAGAGQSSENWDPNMYNAAGGNVNGWSWVGERGPELRYHPAGSRIIDNQTSQQITNNQTFNLYGANNAGWIVDQARQSFVR